MVAFCGKCLHVAVNSLGFEYPVSPVPGPVAGSRPHNEQTCCTRVSWVPVKNTEFQACSCDGFCRSEWAPENQHSFNGLLGKSTPQKC